MPRGTKPTLMDWPTVLRGLIDAEDKAHPLTDAQIAERLGVLTITVNKARNRCGIPNSEIRAADYGRAKEPQ